MLEEGEPIEVKDEERAEVKGPWGARALPSVLNTRTPGDSDWSERPKTQCRTVPGDLRN